MSRTVFSAASSFASKDSTGDAAACRFELVLAALLERADAAAVLAAAAAVFLEAAARFLAAADDRAILNHGRMIEEKKNFSLRESDTPQQTKRAISLLVMFWGSPTGDRQSEV
jgi:hypothetical protein